MGKPPNQSIGVLQNDPSARELCLDSENLSIHTRLLVALASNTRVTRVVIYPAETTNNNMILLATCLASNTTVEEVCFYQSWPGNPTRYQHFLKIWLLTMNYQMLSVALRKLDLHLPDSCAEPFRTFLVKNPSVTELTIGVASIPVINAVRGTAVSCLSFGAFMEMPLEAVSRIETDLGAILTENRIVKLSLRICAAVVLPVGNALRGNQTIQHLFLYLDSPGITGDQLVYSLDAVASVTTLDYLGIAVHDQLTTEMKEAASRILCEMRHLNSFGFKTKGPSWIRILAPMLTFLHKVRFDSRENVSSAPFRFGPALENNTHLRELVIKTNRMSNADITSLSLDLPFITSLEYLKIEDVKFCKDWFDANGATKLLEGVENSSSLKEFVLSTSNSEQLIAIGRENLNAIYLCCKKRKIEFERLLKEGTLSLFPRILGRLNGFGDAEVDFNLRFLLLQNKIDLCLAGNKHLNTD